ncbi:MAG: CPBP family intramembrane metalloprotease [Lachnospiraceae bacterium]|nr:CPBP family intramembrane metalloprotease [Lachnospiraceae bacterium]
MDIHNRKSDLKRILLFIGFAFVLTYVIELIFVLPAAKENRTSDSILYTVLAALAMMMPAISVVITRLVTGEGFGEHYLAPNCGRKTIRYYLMAWFVPALLILAGAAIYFLIYSSQFDWNMSYYMEEMRKTGIKEPVEAIRDTKISQIIAGVILGPVMNIFTSFGEEWGWRGYLLPKLMKSMPLVPSVLLSGVIWGLWYIPFVIAGLNYGMDYTGYPYCGFLMMILFCVVTGIFISYVTIRTKSCIPAIVAHGAINATASAGIFFTKDGGYSLLGPSITGVVGMIPAMITAVIILLFFVRNSACIKESFCDTMSKT